jgi:hypothetical protein
MLNVDGVINIQDTASRLDFINTADSEEPYIEIQRGSKLAGSLDPDYFPRAFPTLFPYSLG